MSWEADDLGFCPNCGAAGTIEVNEARDDYYLGPPRRCRVCKQGFYLSEADVSEHRAPAGPPSPWSELLRDVGRAQLEAHAENTISIFLAELEGGSARVPIIRRAGGG